MVSIAFPLFGLVEELWRRFCDFRFRLSRVPALLLAMSHTVCRHAPGSVPRGYGAVPPCRHGSGDRWGTPRKVPVGSCRWPGQERARLGPGFVHWVRVPPTCLWLLLVAARGLAWHWRPLLLLPKPIC